MKKLLTFFGAGKGASENGGILNLISEKTGKISFRRTAAIIILAKMIPELDFNNLTWAHAAVIGACLLSTAFDKIIESKISK